MSRSLSCSCYWGVVLSAQIVFAAIPRIDALGDLPGGQVRSVAYGISGDGRFVIGSSWTTGENNAEAFVWDAGSGMQRLAPGPGGLNSSQAADISADGNTIAGFREVLQNPNQPNGPTATQACLWKVGQGVTPLGSGNGYGGGIRAISDNGAVAVGWAWNFSALNGVRWTSASTSLTVVGGGSLEVNGISGDGSTLIDRSTHPNGEQAVIRRTASLPIALGLGTSGAALSYDGRVAVGSIPDSQGTLAFRWTQETGFVKFGYFYAAASDVSADGNTIVGVDHFSHTGGPDTAFVWTPQGGIQKVSDVLSRAGVDLSHWTILQYATAVSSDGTVIAGYGVNRFGQEEAFRAVIPEPAVAFFSVCALATLKRARETPRL